MSCGVSHRCGSDLVLPWLWCRPTAAAMIQPLAWELPYAGSAALKSKKKKEKRKEKKELLLVTQEGTTKSSKEDLEANWWALQQFLVPFSVGSSQQWLHMIQRILALEVGLTKVPFVCLFVCLFAVSLGRSCGIWRFPG